jgi:hypothetical protein
VQIVERVGGGPRVVVFCQSADAERAVRASLATSFSIRCCERWSPVELEAAVADCVVAVVPSLQDEGTQDHLKTVTRCAPETPIVVVATRDLQGLDASSTGLAHAVVWLPAVPEQLFPIVAGVLKLSYLEVVARNALGAGSLPEHVRVAIARACRSQAPVNSVERLAMECALPLPTLFDSWRRLKSSAVTPKLFLRWIRLLRAVARKTPARSWESIAVELEVDVDTLWRDATQAAGCRLHDLSLGTIEVIRERFHDVVLHPLGIPAPPARMR